MNTCCEERVGAGLNAAALLVLAMVVLVAGPAAADDIGVKLNEVPEGYARAYTSPFLHAHGPNQNSNLYSTAEIPWGKLTLGVGIKVMGTHLNETDQSFRLVYEDVDLGEIDPALAGMTGDVVFAGPTIFGDTDELGTLEVFSGGVSVYRRDTISGVIDTRMVPLATPEAYVGGLLGLRAVVRWLPTIDRADFGKAELFGYGLQWSPSHLLKTFPVDLMIGFFNQGLDITGDQPGMEGGILSEASSVYLAASYDWPALTLYGGYARESSEMEVYYVYDDPDFGIAGQEIRFTEEGVQENRFTLGVTFDILAKLNLEMAHGKFTTYSVGLMFGN